MEIPVIKKPEYLDLEILEAKFPIYMATKIKDRHRHVYDNLESKWGTVSFNLYIKSLVINDRNDRIGFEKSIMREIYHIKEEHDLVFPSLIEKITDWYDN